MTNLKYLKDFLTKTYGTICFHNDISDGYTVFSKESGKEMETLASYFPNRLDLFNETVKERLSNAVGEKFYESYIGAKGLKLCPVNGSLLLARFSKDGKTLGITVDALAMRLPGGIFDVIQYFIGNEIGHKTLDRPNNYCQPIPANNDFYIGKGANIKECLENFLKRNNLPLVRKENGFFVAPTEETQPDKEGRVFKVNSRGFLKEIKTEFEKEWSQLSLLREQREREFQKSLEFMARSDWEDFKKAMGSDALPVEKNPEFED